MAGGQGHGIHIGDVPGRNDVPPGLRVAAQGFDHTSELIHVSSVRGRPGTPLITVDGSEVAVSVGPFIPDGDAVLMQPGDVGVASQEPQQLAKNRPGVHTFGGQQRKSFGQVESHLVAEDAAGTGAGAIAAVGSVGHDTAQQIQVNLHYCSFSQATKARTALPRWLMASFWVAVSSADVQARPSGRNSGS